MNTRTYSELLMYESFEERFQYLRLGNGVGQATAGFDRYINQMFYMSREWQDARRHVILRDEGCDLGVPGHEIHAGPLIHHMNPITIEDITRREQWILDPEFLITTCHNTHNAIHYGVEKLIPRVVIERQAGDTRLW